MTLEEKKEIKKAKKIWKDNMTNLYPNFSPKKWGMTHYRISHPQLI